MDERGRPNTPAEFDALIARLAVSDDPYEVALEAMNSALDVGEAFDGAVYLLWACFTDWVEFEPDEADDAIAAMRGAALEWPSVRHDLDAAAKYFDYWMFDVMSVTTAIPEGWKLRTEELSAGVYRVTAESINGTSFSDTGTNRLDLTGAMAERARAAAED